MKNIIIPIDFSQQSEFALQTGAILAKKHNATIHVLHMLELSDAFISQSDSQSKNEMLFMLSLTNKKLKPFLDKDYLEGINVIPVIKRHKVYDEVNALAKEINADLIIMGSQGITLQDGIFAGSNAEKMVRNSSTPVLIVKSHPKDFNLKNVIFATDMSLESIPAYKKAIEIFSVLSSNVLPVYVNRPFNNFINSKEFNAKLKKFSEAGGSDQVKFIAGYTIEDGLIQFAEETNAGAIAISTNARKGLNRILRESISENLANTSKLPVMTFKL
ncbi:MAG: universal stress protein [Lutibacter sp.]|nr:universal stress protein [Lutibacter sp.]